MLTSQLRLENYDLLTWVPVCVLYQKCCESGVMRRCTIAGCHPLLYRSMMMANAGQGELDNSQPWSLLWYLSLSLSLWPLMFKVWEKKLQLCGLLFVRASLYLGSIWKYPKWDSYKIRSPVIGMDTETPLSVGIWGRCRCLGWTRVSALGLQILGRLDKGEGGEGIRAPRKRWEIDWSSWRQESCPSQPLSVKYLFANTPPTYNIYTGNRLDHF